MPCSTSRRGDAPRPRPRSSARRAARRPRRASGTAPASRRGARANSVSARPDTASSGGGVPRRHEHRLGLVGGVDERVRALAVPRRAPSAAQGAQTTPRSSSTCPTRRASSSRSGASGAAARASRAGRGRSGSAPREIDFELEPRGELPEQRRAVGDRRAGQLGEVVEQRLGRIALAAQLGDRRRALALGELRAGLATPAAPCARTAAGAGRARRTAAICRAVLVRWSSPRMTCVISISASSTAVASW